MSTDSSIVSSRIQGTSYQVAYKSIGYIHRLHQVHLVITLRKVSTLNGGIGSTQTRLLPTLDVGKLG